MTSIHPTTMRFPGGAFCGDRNCTPQVSPSCWVRTTAPAFPIGREEPATCFPLLPSHSFGGLSSPDIFSDAPDSPQPLWSQLPVPASSGRAASSRPEVTLLTVAPLPASRDVSLGISFRQHRQAAASTEAGKTLLRPSTSPSPFFSLVPANMPLLRRRPLLSHMAKQQQSTRGEQGDQRGSLSLRCLTTSPRRGRG